MDAKETKKEAKAAKDVERASDQVVYRPDVDIVETDAEVVVTADMPGVDEKSVSVTLEDEILAIEGKVEARGCDGHRLAVQEYGVGNFERNYRILSDVDASAIHAKVKNGVVRVVLPKSKKARRRVIPITAE
jgi:HSP20 family molecular chaperone IbpA